MRVVMMMVMMVTTMMMMLSTAYGSTHIDTLYTLYTLYTIQPPSTLASPPHPTTPRHTHHVFSNGAGLTGSLQHSEAQQACHDNLTQQRLLVGKGGVDLVGAQPRAIRVEKHALGAEGPYAGPCVLCSDVADQLCMCVWGGCWRGRHMNTHTHTLYTPCTHIIHTLKPKAHTNSPASINSTKNSKHHHPTTPEEGAGVLTQTAPGTLLG